MVSNEVYPEPVYNLQDYDDDDEEALSLCDLPIYSGSFESEDRFSSSKEDYQSSSDDQDFFEFFSQDFSTTSAENIIFCGKLIPYKNPEKTTHNLHQINKKQPPPPPPSPQKKKKSFFQWRSKSLDKSKTSKDNTAKRQITNTNNNKYGSSVKKVPMLTSPTKSRWHLFLFGLARLPTEMELTDMRSRQHRRTPSSSTLFPSFDKDREMKAGRTSRGIGLWRLLRVLGCRSIDANTVVKASGARI